MKFRYKVLLINLIVLSIALGVIEYLSVRRNFFNSIDSELSVAVSENNLFKASLEYEFLSLLNNPTYNSYIPTSAVNDMVKKVHNGVLISESSLYVIYNDELIYTGDDDVESIPKEITSNENHKKIYYIKKINNKHYIFIRSESIFDKYNFTIISKKNISKVYTQLKNNLNFMRILSLIVLVIAAIIIYLVSYYLTRPLEELNKVTTRISGGEYDVRADNKSDDEVGILADNFNTMAGSVEEYIGELKDMVHRRDQFVADFTHEMKTPMTTIIGYADTLKNVELSEDEKNMSLDYIYSEGKRLETMSQKLFKLIYLKSHDIPMEEVSADEMGKEVVLLMKPVMDRKKIKVISNFEKGDIYGDKELIKTVFINILDNARKASNEGSDIYFNGHVVEDEANEKMYEVTIKDNGIGISEEDQKKIFDEFYMVDKSRARKEGGAGLGMSLVSIILNRHNAKVLIDSELGKGTTFTIKWPMTGMESNEETLE